MFFIVFLWSPILHVLILHGCQFVKLFWAPWNQGKQVQLLLPGMSHIMELQHKLSDS